MRSRSREIELNPWNPAKFTKTRKIPRNSVEILSNTCLYSNFETCLSYWGYLLAVNSQIYVKTSSLKRANNVPKLPGVDYVAKNWALAMMLKALPLVHFWSVLLLKEQMMTSVRKTLKTLVWSTQNRSISSEVCPENNHKISRFFTDCFSTKFVPKIPAKFREIGRFFRDFVPKNPAKFDFFFRNLSEALPWEFPKKANHLCQVLKHGDEPSDCESSCPCYYSQIEGLGLHVVNIHVML